MSLDFSGFVFLTTTYSKRLPLLVSTLSNVMSRVHKAEFVVQWYEDDLEGFDYAKSILSMLADATENYLTFNTCPASMSVAHTKVYFEAKTVLKWFVNLDDDLVIPTRALERLLSETTQVQVVTLGVMDPVNVRGFDDYDKVKWNSEEDFLKSHIRYKAKHHLFNNELVLKDMKCISQLYALEHSVFLDKSVWAPVIEKFAEKGIRGYDIALEQSLTQHGYKINLLSGNEAWHLGLEHQYLGGPWAGADEVTKDIAVISALQMDKQ